MDPIKNPFSPGAGAPPPELAGRQPVLDQAKILLGRVRQGRPEKSMLLTGLRGVGKTVLLNEIGRISNEESWHVISIEASEDKPLGILLAPYLRTLLFELSRLEGTKDKIRRGFAVLRSFVGALKFSIGEVSLGLDVEPETGTADSGDLEIDLPNLIIAIAEAAAERKQAVAILIDEIQYFNFKELGALIMAMHKTQQRRLPLILLGAGLPTLPGLAGDSKSYAERLFSFPEIGALSPEDSIKALQDPAESEGARFEEDALAEIFKFTQGYPYFLQEWGYQSWNLSPTETITLEVVKNASATVISRLDKNFFRVRFDRLTPGEKHFMRTMAELGNGAHRVGDVAGRLKSKVKALGPVRAKLIGKGMIYSPEYGQIAFTVPLFDAFMKRVMPKN